MGVKNNITVILFEGRWYGFCLVRNHTILFYRVFMLNLTLLGKYRNIIISVALFLLLDASVLIFNFYVSFEISEDAAGVNLAGRQRMLSQRMSKSLFDIAYSANNEDQRNKAINELASTVTLFDITFNAFKQGGTVTSAEGDQVKLEAAKTLDAVKALNNASVIWGQYYPKLQTILNARSTLSNIAIDDAILFAKNNNLLLLKSMNNLTVELERIASSKAKRLRIIQTIGISLALINFFIIMFHFLKQLRESDRKIESARKETSEILETVNEGLFLINSERVIGSQYSIKMEELFNRKNIAGQSLESILEPILPAKDLDNTKRFIALLYREEIKSNLIKDLNPLKKINVNIYDHQERYISKHLSFMFERVYEGQIIKDILVTVNDITDRVILEKELEIAREKNERQLEVLTGIIHADPVLTRSFIKDTFNILNNINQTFKKRSITSSSFKSKINAIFIQIHKIKGDAAGLNLESFEEICHDFETQLEETKKIDNINGDDFIPLIVQLEKLIHHTESMEALTQKLRAFAQYSDSSKTDSDIGTPLNTETTWQHLDELTKVISLRQEKDVELVCSGLKDVLLDNNHTDFINTIVVQCIRNAIVHSIELPSERVGKNKPAVGRIDVRLARLNNVFELTISDDGYGIDCEKIREKLHEKGDDHQIWSNKQLIASIFDSGFSTYNKADKDGGRGIGMDVIKQKIKIKKGFINIKNNTGHGVTFTFTFPISTSDKL